MEDYRGHPGTTRHQAWHVAHVVATILTPWVLAAYYWRSQPQTITAEAALVADFHTMAAIAASVLLLSTVLLRISGRRIAATVPFAVMWMVALAYSISQMQEYGGEFHCDDDLCMPDFGLFFTAVPFAGAVSFAVLGSAVISRAA